MVTVFEHLMNYAVGNKGHLHKRRNGKLRENKNVTKVQNLLTGHMGRTKHDGE